VIRPVLRQGRPAPGRALGRPARRSPGGRVRHPAAQGL